LSFQHLRVEGLSRTYGDDYALIELNAEFSAGKITALLGPNGAGKSTLIALLTGLLRPSEGEIYFGQRATRPDAKLRAQIGYLGHRSMLYGALSARENLRFFQGLYSSPDLQYGERLLERLNLRRDGDRPVEGFSRGMVQRLSLARALLNRPQLLLLDEPLSGLDQAGVEIALSLIQERAQAGGIVLLATHDLKAAARCAEEALILRRGRHRYQGPLEADLPQQYQRLLEERR